MTLGIPSRVLYVDLSRRRYELVDRSDLFEGYIGGTGVAVKLLMEECPRNADPLGSENPIIISVGPFNGLFPVASKTVAMFKSPHTKNLGESHAGGRSSAVIRLAGYGAIVIKGVSETPIYVAIHGDRVYFRDASALWGMSSTLTVGRVLRELEPGSGIRTIMRIGLAGERMVSYASVCVDTFRHFGRLGLGAVFGSKKLKALVISGKKSLKVKDPKGYREVYDEIYNLSIKSPLMKKYYELGTPMNINPLNSIKGLPVMNLKASSSDKAFEISGERMARDYLGRRFSCSHCPVSCVHIAALRVPYETEPYFYKTEMISYDYEPTYALGSMLGVFDPEGMLKLLDSVEKFGLDAMSTGVALAWTTEAFDRGLIGDKETMSLRIRFGDYKTYIKAVHLIATRANDFYSNLACGVEHASSVYGGKEFALAFGGNEMPGYHTGPLAYAGFMTGGRHSHLDSAGYSLDQKFLKSGLPSPEEGAELLFKEEAWRQVLTSLVVCLFSRKIYRPGLVARALKVLGLEFTEDGLMDLGKKILRMKNEFKMREGFRPEGLRIPKRILEIKSPNGMVDGEYLLRVVKRFYELVGILPPS